MDKVSRLRIIQKGRENSSNVGRKSYVQSVDLKEWVWNAALGLPFIACINSDKPVCFSMSVSNVKIAIAASKKKKKDCEE